MRFETLLDPEQMPGQRSPLYPWPYIEGLRLDEAMHDLTILATGLYGKTLLPQNGAPLRAGGAVEVRLQEHQVHRQDRPGRAEMPGTFWMAAAPERVRLLRQRQPRRVASALVAGQRAAHRRVGPADDAAVQRLRRSSRVAVHRHGSQGELLIAGRPTDRSLRVPGSSPKPEPNDAPKRSALERHIFQVIVHLDHSCRWRCWSWTGCATT